MALANPERRLSEAQYLEIERAADFKSDEIHRQKDVLGEYSLRVFNEFIVGGGFRAKMIQIKKAMGTADGRIAIVVLMVVALDQFTKEIVLRSLGYAQAKVIIPGFFKFVYWDNTGAAWSLFRGNNDLLAVVALFALVALFFSRRHFDFRTPLGPLALGLIFGGIIGNLIDRIRVKHVIDFIYFYLQQRGGTEIGFPAFNIADSAICTGVGLIFLLTWRNEHGPQPAASDLQARSR